MTPFDILLGTRNLPRVASKQNPLCSSHAIQSLGTSLGILQIRFVTVRWYHNNIPMILRYDGRRTADIVTENPSFIT
jgi:hypothetical protein